MNTQETYYRWFESHGMRIAIDLHKNACFKDIPESAQARQEVSDLLDALLLAENDRLVQCLDEWIGIDGHWRPVTDSPDDGRAHVPLGLHEHTAMPVVTASLKTLDSANQEIYACIPNAELSQLPQLPGKWRDSVRINSHVHEIRLRLFRTGMTAEETTSIEPGAMILLKDSFNEDWEVDIEFVPSQYSRESITNVAVRLDKAASTIRLLPLNEARPESSNSVAESRQLSVYLAKHNHFNRLYAESIWNAGGTMVLALEESIEGARVMVKTDNPEPGTNSHCLPGVVVKIGNGLAVLLDKQAV